MGVVDTPDLGLHGDGHRLGILEMQMHASGRRVLRVVIQCDAVSHCEWREPLSVGS